MKADDPHRFEGYFKSDEHNQRMKAAIVRTTDSLAAIGKEDVFAGLSAALGTLFGVAHFYRTLGLKHQGAKVFTEVFRWLKTGTD